MLEILPPILVTQYACRICTSYTVVSRVVDPGPVVLVESGCLVVSGSVFLKSPTSDPVFFRIGSGSGYNQIILSQIINF